MFMAKVREVNEIQFQPPIDPLRRFLRLRIITLFLFLYSAICFCTTSNSLFAFEIKIYQSFCEKAFDYNLVL